MRWRAASFWALSTGALLSLNARHGSAKPRWNAAWESALCGVGDSDGLSRAAWCNALRADVLLLREGNHGFDVGPTLRLGTAAFDDVRLDVGATVLIPISESFPLLLEAGPHFRNGNQLGAFGCAFFGLRSFNYYGHYEMSAGLALMAERTFGHDAQSALWLAARIDGSWLALPFIFGYNALR